MRDQQQDRNLAVRAQVAEPTLDLDGMESLDLNNDSLEEETLEVSQAVAQQCFEDHHKCQPLAKRLSPIQGLYAVFKQEREIPQGSSDPPNKKRKQKIMQILESNSKICKG